MLPRSRVNMWREAWTRCYRVVENWERPDIAQFHVALEQWIPILNRALGSPIRRLDKYQMSFYPCTESPGPKEILHFYVDETATPDGQQSVFLLFNQKEFRELVVRHCNDFSRHNEMLVDEARGTINMALSSGQPATYFKSMTTWQMLFLFTCHAMAHLDVFDTYDHAYYENHQRVRESVFYKLNFYGQVVYN